MGLSNVVLIVAAAILLGSISCTAKNDTPRLVPEIAPYEREYAPTTAGNTNRDEKQILRFLEVARVAEGDEEERALNFAYLKNLKNLKNLKKYIPKADTLKAAMKAAQAKKAAKAADKLKKNNLFKLPGTTDDQLISKFREWRAQGKSSADVTNGIFKTNGMKQNDAITIGNRYQVYLNDFG
ncbi:hypothetical protein AM587_10011978 [Phytophthora nicotianae]|uniref:Uncharacterized protein n=1 Tax=Phytophthora nicotianae TaxID=4792 RepID=A0A0W8C4S9_PHYNI|nr:hypothetical protein AM587_10011978 [Phytophthora nicotianae]